MTELKGQFFKIMYTFTAKKPANQGNRVYIEIPLIGKIVNKIS
jgi:hypothetical protein